MGYSEPLEPLDEQSRDYSRALNSIKEELEAIDWYTQRISATGDEQLRAILDHNRLEEMEHATLLFEWLRRRMPGWEEQMRRYLFTQGDVSALEQQAEQGLQLDLGIGKP
jgi:ferritin-like protein